MTEAFSGKTVLVTGHTGFKGSWLSLWLLRLGAEVVGYSLAPDTEPSLFSQLGLSGLMESRIGDVRDSKSLNAAFLSAKPEFVFHLAAQALVRRSYEDPVNTFTTNVEGTARVLEAVRKTDSVRVCQIITSDKCYENRESPRPYREDDPLGGHDPYSASKACAEIAVSSWRRSFFRKGDVSVSSCRAGNVIGGGDWAEDRIVPDCIRSLMAGRDIPVRRPRSIRPWQFVLEPLSGYLMLAAAQRREPAKFAGAWNFGPQEDKALTAAELVDRVIRRWGEGRWVAAEDPSAPHEAGLLRLDSGKARDILGWKPTYGVEQAVDETVSWYRSSVKALERSQAQLAAYEAKAR
ncbi:MAG: CDP-glucose 4,6-dehydratase [Elusimicrobiota bacterium]